MISIRVRVLLATGLLLAGFLYYVHHRMSREVERTLRQSEWTSANNYATMVIRRISNESARLASLCAMAASVPRAPGSPGIQFKTNDLAALRIDLEATLSRAGTAEWATRSPDLITNFLDRAELQHVFDGISRKGTYSGIAFHQRTPWMLAARPTAPDSPATSDVVLCALRLDSIAWSNDVTAFLPRGVTVTIDPLTPPLQYGANAVTVHCDTNAQGYACMTAFDLLDSQRRAAARCRIAVPPYQQQMATTYLDRTFTTLIVLGGLFFLLILLLDEFLVLRPLLKLSKRIEAIATGNPQNDRLPPGPRDELGIVARSVNGLLDAVHGAEQARQATLQAALETQRLESVGLLAGSIAHDFNNLLTVIQGHLELALDATDQEPLPREDLEAALQAARNAGNLTHQLLVYSGRGRFEMETFDVNQLIRDMSCMLPPTVSRSAEIVYELGADPAWILGDRMQVWQVVMNLILNASDALRERRGRIEVRTSTQSDVQCSCAAATTPPSGACVHIEVRDDGPGMEETVLRRVFEPFFTTKGKGRGLGLAAVQGIVRAHGGCICVESAAGKGSRFVVLLPVAAAPAHPVEPAVTRAHPRNGRPAVLIAEDEPEIRTALAHTLEAAGWNCTMTGNGREAVGQFAEAPGRFAAVLLDLIMPEMDGREAFLEIKRVRPDVPIVLMSGYSAEDWRDLLPRAAGAISKPFTRQRLLEALEAVRPS